MCERESGSLDTGAVHKGLWIHLEGSGLLSFKERKERNEIRIQSEKGYRACNEKACKGGYLMSLTFLEYFLQRNAYLVFQPIFFNDNESDRLSLYGFEVLTRFKTDVDLLRFFSRIYEEPTKFLTFYKWQCEKLLELKDDILFFNAKLFINVSSCCFFFLPFLETFEKLDSEFSNRLVIEIVEGSFNGDMGLFIQALSRFVKHFDDILFFVDDFGSGETIFYRTFCEGLIDGVKIDKRFLSMSLQGERRAELIVKHVVEMSKETGLLTCLEGIETQEGYMFAKKMDFDLLQGFYLCKPEKLEKLKNTEVLYGDNARVIAEGS